MKKLIYLFAAALFTILSSCAPAPGGGGDTGNYKFPSYSASWGLKYDLYERAVRYYEGYFQSIPNKRYVTIVDFSQHSSAKRFYLFDLEKGTVSAHNTSHGQGSDPDADGYATKFSNTDGSHMSSLGFYVTLDTYTGSNGYSLRLRGMESTNDNAERRAIVVHPADYVSDSANRAGRSHGCPALDPKYSASVINKIKGGSLFLIGT